MPSTEFPAEVAALLGRLRDRLAAREDVVGVYVYGSLATGDYSPAASDIDVVVLVRRGPDKAVTQDLTELHTDLAGTGGPAGQLHCLYVAVDAASDPERLCTYWFGDRMTQWRMKLLTQAELAAAGVALPRAAALLTAGDLISKSEAISRLAGFGVPVSLIQEIRARRDGRPVTLGRSRRLSRALLTRRIMQDGIVRLSLLAPPSLHIN
jgi:predicted nucleotidyltransferase